MSALRPRRGAGRQSDPRPPIRAQRDNRCLAPRLHVVRRHDPYLGKLVEAELRRHSQTNLAITPADAPVRDEAIAALHDVRRSIDELDDIAGRLARSAVAEGASWDDVGSSLRLRADVAENAYVRRSG